MDSFLGFRRIERRNCSQPVRIFPRPAFSTNIRIGGGGIIPEKHRIHANELQLGNSAFDSIFVIRMDTNMPAASALNRWRWFDRIAFEAHSCYQSG